MLPSQRMCRATRLCSALTSLSHTDKNNRENVTATKRKLDYVLLDGQN